MSNVRRLKQVMLNAGKIPSELRGLIFLAGRFGIVDDLQREIAVGLASEDELAMLKQAVARHGDALDAWLAGPESLGTAFSDEYLAFSAMRMAADFALL